MEGKSILSNFSNKEILEIWDKYRGKYPSFVHWCNCIEETQIDDIELFKSGNASLIKRKKKSSSTK